VQKKLKKGQTGQIKAPLPRYYLALFSEKRFFALRSLKGIRYAPITETRKRVDWAYFIKKLLDDKYPKAKKSVLIMDNLNTHGIASFHESFFPEEALRLADKLEIHYTPKRQLIKRFRM
jgi:hypothetical protein